MASPPGSVWVLVEGSSAVLEQSRGVLERGDGDRSQIFRTRQSFDPPGLIRTFGTVLDAGAISPGFTPEDAMRNAPGRSPENCARGKVAAFARVGNHSDVACYQVSDDGAEANLVACGNSTAAVAARLAGHGLGGQVRMRVELPGEHFVHVYARVGPEHWSSGRWVRQRWTEVPFALQGETLVGGRRCTFCLGPLNNYLVVHVERAEELAEFSCAEAAAMWERFGLLDEPLLSRLAVVHQPPRDIPAARFFTCGDREHPSAPLTGLAVLLLAAKHSRSRPVSPSGFLRTPLGLMRLPRVQISARGAATVEFPPLIVDVSDTVRPVLLEGAGGLG